MKRPRAADNSRSAMLQTPAKSTRIDRGITGFPATKPDASQSVSLQRTGAHADSVPQLEWEGADAGRPKKYYLDLFNDALSTMLGREAYLFVESDVDIFRRYQSLPGIQLSWRNRVRQLIDGVR